MSDEEFKPYMSSSSGKGKKRARGRGSVACDSCRRRKITCDLVGPSCGACKAKGEEDSCSFQNLLWYDDPAQIPSHQLRIKSDKRASLTHKLRTSSSSSSARSASSSQHSLSSSLGSSPRTSLTQSAPNESELLSKLLLEPSTAAATLTSVDLSALLQELNALNERTPIPPLPHLAEPNILHTRPSSETFTSLLSLMPTRRQSTAAIAAFFSHIDPLLRVVHRSRFEVLCSDFWATGSTEDSSWLATFLAIVGLGLLSMTDQEAATFGMPTGEGKGLLARSWLDGGLQALASGGFFNSPTLESIRAFILVSLFWTSWQSGKHLGEATRLSGSVIAAAYELELHRDPDELVQDFSPIDAEDRRRVFWALFSLDTLLRTFLGKTYSPLSDLSSITTRIPSSLPDESRTRSGAFDFNFDQTTSTSSLKTVAALHTIVAVHAKLNKLLAGPTRMSPARVSAMLEELEAISAGVTPTDNEAAVISESLAAVLMSFAYVRLHRSCLAGESGDASWHRDSLVQQSTTLSQALESVQDLSPTASLFGSAACLQGAIVLAVESQDSSSTSKRSRSILSSTVGSLDSPTHRPPHPTLTGRASVIIRHVLSRSNGESSVAAPSPLPIASSFSGTGSGLTRSESTSSTASSYEMRFVDTPPSFLLNNQPDYRPDPYLAPLPVHYNTENYTAEPATYYDYSPETHDYDSYEGHHHNTRSLSASSSLLKPWLASTQSLVSPLCERNPWNLTAHDHVLHDIVA